MNDRQKTPEPPSSNLSSRSWAWAPRRGGGGHRKRASFQSSNGRGIPALSADRQLTPMRATSKPRHQRTYFRLQPAHRQTDGRRWQKAAQGNRSATPEWPSRDLGSSFRFVPLLTREAITQALVGGVRLFAFVGRRFLADGVGVRSFHDIAWSWSNAVRRLVPFMRQPRAWLALDARSGLRPTIGVVDVRLGALLFRWSSVSRAWSLHCIARKCLLVRSAIGRPAQHPAAAWGRTFRGEVPFLRGGLG